MIFAAGIAVAGGVLVVKKLKARRTARPMIDALIAPSATTPSTDSSISSLASKPLLNLDSIPAEKHLLLSGGTLGLRMISLAGVPFAGPVSLVSLLYLDLYFLRRAYVEWKSEGVMGVTDAAVATGLLLTRQFGADAFFATTFFVSRKLIKQTETELAERLSDHKPSSPLIETNTLLRPAEAVTEATTSVAIADGQEKSATPMTWQTLIRQGTLPFITLSTLSIPFLGAKRSLAVLLTNFSYDYRVTAPLSTLTYMDLAAQQEIVIADWRAFEKLSQVDVVLLDEQFFVQPMTDPVGDEANAPLPTGSLWDQLQQAAGRKWILVRKAGGDSESAPPIANVTTIASNEVQALLDQLRADKRAVCLVRGAPLTVEDKAVVVPPQADVIVTIRDRQTTRTGLEQLADEQAHIALATSSAEQLFTLFQLADQLAHNLKRGFAITLLPSIIGLAGIYFFHFGASSMLLLDNSALAAGVLNARWSRLNAQARPSAQHTVANPAVTT